MTPHKHAELIHAWADGAAIQCKEFGNDWKDDDFPLWFSTSEYRVKKLEDPVFFTEVLASNFDCFENQNSTHNLKLTFCRETGHLKSAELLK